MNTNEQKLSRSLKARHIMMIALGGAIGAGMFKGSSTWCNTGLHYWWYHFAFCNEGARRNGGP